MSLLQIHEPGETPLPHASDRIAVGIDLGTTNSLVAVSSEGRPEVIPGPDGSPLVPSVVSYGGEAGELAIVGRLARELLGHRPETVVSSIKRLMGRGIEDVKRLAGALPFHVEGEGEGARGGMVRLRVAGRILSPVEISADILREMKARAEHALGRPVEQAVITVPAYFDDAARAATKDAAKLAGLDVLRLVNEPTAAALAYGLDKGAEGLYAVYDLGGGTFDVSLLRLEKGVFQVLATGGDAALGGDDFDHAVAEHLLAERGGAAAGVAAVQTALRVARDMKEALSGAEHAQASLTIAGHTTAHALDRTAFDALIAPLVEVTIATCAQVLADAGVAPCDVQGVVLVGGSSRVPLVRRRVAECFAQMPLADIDPDAVVALGAALQAEALTVGSNTLLLDVTPLSLGIETMGGLVEKVVPRNTPIPVAMAQEFTTYQDGQDAMVIHVVQGEREMVHQCRSLARFTLSGIPPMTAGAARVRVAFTVDADGLLMVSASESTTGVRQQVIVKPSYGLAEGEVERMLRDSMVNARADMEERLLAGARVEAERALLALAAARAADADLLSPHEAAAIDAAVAAVRAAMRGAERHVIDERIEALEKCTREFAERRMDRGVRSALAGVALGRLERALAGDA